MKNKVYGYTEWISKDPEFRVSFITNCFNRVLYINKNYPDGDYERIRGVDKSFFKSNKELLEKGRSFTKEDLLLELI